MSSYESESVTKLIFPVANYQIPSGTLKEGDKISIAVDIYDSTNTKKNSFPDVISYTLVGYPTPDRSSEVLGTLNMFFSESPINI